MMAFGFPETIKLVQRKGEESARPFSTIAVTRCPMQLRFVSLGPTVFLLKLPLRKVTILLLKSLVTRIVIFALEKVLKGIEHAGK